jgi:putative tRNA adenosine deaminase-associated protein
VTYVATALARIDAQWNGDDVSLSDVEDLDGVLDAMRQATDDDADPVLLFVEEDDEWFAVVRLDGDGDPRVFVSDSRVVETSEVAALFAEGVVDSDADDEDDTETDVTVEDDDEVAGAVIDGEPAGDMALLEDLGTSPARLLAHCTAEGKLPGDVISELAEAAGCLDMLEKLRGL